MFRRFLILMVSAVLLCSVALAEVDVSGLSDQELKDLISDCSAELRKRAASTDPEGILLFDQGGMRLYQTGDAVFNSDKGTITVPVLVVNDSDVRACCGHDNLICNGWQIFEAGGTDSAPHSRHMADLTYFVSDVGLTSLDDIYSLSGNWYVLSSDVGYIYQQETPEEFRYW